MPNDNRTKEKRDKATEKYAKQQAKSKPGRSDKPTNDPTREGQKRAYDAINDFKRDFQ